MNSLPKTVTRQRRDCDLKPGPSVPESSTLTTRLPSHPWHYFVHITKSQEGSLTPSGRNFFCALCRWVHVFSGAYATVKSWIGQLGDQVTLFSPLETFDEGVELLFAYHMWLSDDDTTAALSDDDTTAALSVYTYSQMHVYERRLLEIRGNHGISWQYESVCLPGGTYQLAFVATHGLQFLSDIALDEIDIYYEEPSYCLSHFYDYDDEEYDRKYFLYNSAIL